MQVVCKSCKQVLANIEVLIPFGMQVSCGECGWNGGYSMVPPPPPPEPVPAPDPVTA